MTVLRQIEKYRRWFDQSQFKKTTVPKLLSLLFAIVFWIYVMDQVNPEMERTLVKVPVEIMDQEAIVSGGFKLMTEEEVFVDVKIKGRRSDVLKVTNDDVHIVADLPTIQEGKVKVPLDRKVYRDGIKVDSLSQNEITLQIDRIVTLDKPVVLKTTGTLPEGYAADQLPALQDRVAVVGPRTLVAKVQRMEGTVDLNAIQNGTKTRIKLVPIDASGTIVEGVEPVTDTLSMDLAVYQVVKLPIAVDFKGNVASGYGLIDTQLNISEVELRLKDKTDLPLKIMTEPVTIEGLSESKSVELGLIIPESLAKVLGDAYVAQKVKVDLRVEKLTTKELTIPLEKVRFVGLPAELVADLQPVDAGIRVIVTDYQSKLSGMTSDDMEVTIDVSGMAIGSHKAPVKVSFTSTPRQWDIVPDQIVLELKAK